MNNTDPVPALPVEETGTDHDLNSSPHQEFASRPCPACQRDAALADLAAARARIRDAEAQAASHRDEIRTLRAEVIALTRKLAYETHWLTKQRELTEATIEDLRRSEAEVTSLGERNEQLADALGRVAVDSDAPTMGDDFEAWLALGRIRGLVGSLRVQGLLPRAALSGDQQ